MPVSKESDRIKKMFAGISMRYDLLNHVLSLNIDKLWRRRTVRELDIQPGDKLLDVCTGTGDLALEMARHVAKEAGGEVFGSDFCKEMVALGERKRRKKREDRVSLLVADTLELPFADETFDAIAVAFGIRNVCDLDAGLSEMLRVLKPGGKLAILEFTTSRHPWMRKIYGIYFNRVLPRIGRWLSGTASGRTGSGRTASGETSSDRSSSDGASPEESSPGDDAYSYLPRSVAEFPDAEALRKKLEELGLTSVRYRYLSMGIAALHIGVRAASRVTPLEPLEPLESLESPL